MGASDWHKKEEEKEAAMVFMTHTIAKPRTVMIHFLDASVALTTVMRSRGLESLAYFAELHVGAVLEKTGLPTKGQIPRSNIDSAQVMVKNQRDNRQKT